MQQITPIQFLKTVFGEPVGPGRLALFTRTGRSRSGRAYWPNNLDEAARQVCHYRKSRDVYVCASLQNRDLALEIARRRRPRARKRHVRCSEPSATVLPALWAEIVAAGPAADACRRPPDLEAVLRVLEAVDRQPSIAIHTGAGFQLYWLLREPLMLDTGEAQRAARRLLLKLQSALAAAAAEHDLRVDQSADPAKMLYVPGTLNHAFQPAVEVTVERFPVGLEDRRTWAPEDFDALPEPGTGTGLETLMRDPGADRDRGPAADFRRVHGGCRFLQYCYRERAGLPESEWLAALEAVARCRIGDADGRRLVHRFSRDHPGYTVSATDAEIDLALFAREPSTCRQIAELSVRAAACCAGCVHRGRIEGPLALGAQPALPAESRDGDLPICRPAAPGPAAPEPAAAGTPAALPAGVEPAPGAGGPQMVIASWERAAGEAPETVRSTVIWIGGTPGPVLAPADGPVLPPPGGPVLPPAGGPDRPPGVQDLSRRLAGGLGELLETLGGTATSKEILEELARSSRTGAGRAPGGRYRKLRSALAELFPNPDAEMLPTPAQLSARLRRLRGRPAGGRRIEQGPRTARGVRWSVRRAEETPTTTDKEERPWPTTTT